MEQVGEGWDVVSFTVMGTNAAADRLLAVSWHDDHLAYAAAGETLWWITVLDSMLTRTLGKAYTNDPQRESVDRKLLGLKYARNRLTHVFDVLQPVEPGGNPSNAAFGTPGYWKWGQLEPMRRKGNEGEPEYQALLAGELVQSTLTHVLTFLRMKAWYKGTAVENG